jgi:hypothetical protein
MFTMKIDRLCIHLLLLIVPFTSLANDSIRETNHRSCTLYNEKSSLPASAEVTIARYLKTVSTGSDDFYIQGWRWHTLSLGREAGRLQKLAERLHHSFDSNNVDLTAVKNAADYVVGFNMNGLHKIEKDLFFPWVRSKISSLKEKEVKGAVGALMDQLDLGREAIKTFGKSVVSGIDDSCLLLGDTRHN